jgi:hypothetical protein
MTGSWYGLNPETVNAKLVRQVGTIGPDEIHIRLAHGKSAGQVAVDADAPGVVIEVTRK